MKRVAEAPAPLEVLVQNPKGFAGLEVSSVGAWLRRMISDLAPQAESVAVRFTNDAEMRRFNLEFRKRDHSTDVLSFPGERTLAGYHLGDIVISVPMARLQAKERGSSTRREIKLLLLHGVLHCLGYDHEADDGQMQQMESNLCEKWVEEGD
jgi:probable rRNA maturation factor